MKTRITISVDEHLATRVAEMAERSGLSSSAIVNTCLRYALPKLEDGPLMNPSAVTRSREAVSILIVEDSKADVELIIGELRRADYEPRVEIVETAGEMEKALRKGGWDFIFSDWILPQFSGLEALHLHQKSGVTTPIIIVSGRIGEEATVEAMQAGADDYVLKDRLETLAPTMERILARRAKRSSNSSNLSPSQTKESPR
jgi:DNA-binding NtrC family response regulator